MGCGQSTPNQPHSPTGNQQKQQQYPSPAGGLGARNKNTQEPFAATHGAVPPRSPQQSQGPHHQTTTATTTAVSAAGGATTTAKQSTQPYVVPSTNPGASEKPNTASNDNLKQTTILYPPQNNLPSSTSVKKTTTSLINKISPSSSKKVRNTSSVAGASNNKGGKGGGKNNTHVPPAPLVVRPRSDTWAESNNNASNVTQHQQHSLDITLDCPPGDSDDQQQYNHSDNLSNSKQQQQVPRSIKQLPQLTASDGNDHRLGNISITPEGYMDSSFYPYTIQDQWRMLWETQSQNLVDPADVPAVLDLLLDKIVNRLSPTQLTFLQRKVRSTIHRMYTSSTAASTKRSNPSGPTGNKKGLFGSSSSNNINGMSHNSTSANALAEIAETKALIKNHHMLSAAVIRQILPKASASNSNAALVMSAITKNAITLMLSLSFTSSQSFLWNRTAFASQAAAQVANLEMDVNKKKKGSATIPKPSQVPIIEGGEDTNLYPPGITLTALSAIVSLALQSQFRYQKLQLLFYLCLKPEDLIEFLTTHPAGGIPVWLLEVGNDTVISLASLTHYHYFGHAFLPSYVPTHDEIKNINVPATSTTKNGSNAYDRHSVKNNFISSQSRQPISVPMNRVQNIIQVLLDAERQNLKSFQEKKSKIVQVGGCNDKNGKFVNDTSPHDYSSQSFNTNATASNGSGHPPQAISSYYVRRYRALESTDSNQQSSGNSSSTPGNVRDTINNSLNSSLHKKMIGRKGSLNNLSSSTQNDGNSTTGLEDGSNTHFSNNNSDVSALFQMTEVMERLAEQGDGGIDASDPSASVYCYPPDTSATVLPIDVSRDKYFSATSEFLRTKSKAMDEFNNIDLTLEDFATWTEVALDDLALNVIMHKLFGEGIFPSPAMERDLVLNKWLEWQNAIRVIMKVANVINRRGVANNNAAPVDMFKGSNNNDSQSGSTVHDNNGISDKSADYHQQQGSAVENTIPLSESIHALLSNDTFDASSCIENNPTNNPTNNHNASTLDMNGGGHNSNSGLSTAFQRIYKSGDLALSTRSRKRGINSFFVWGGIGFVDGGGGMGYGVLYCIAKEWWDEWTNYTGWTFMESIHNPSATNHDNVNGNSDSITNTKTTRYHKEEKRRQLCRFGEKRPWSISTESLLEPEHDSIIRGSMGSYEVMKQGLARGVDYVLVPPGVWDVLFEMYGGGPPLPRMVRSPESHAIDSNRTGGKSGTGDDDISQCKQQQRQLLVDEVDGREIDTFGDANIDRKEDSNAPNAVVIDEYQMNEVEVVPIFSIPKAMRIPDGISVTLYPWVLHVQLCDPMQPYRRGEAGHLSIRVQSTPYQPLWRFFAEVVCRFSFQSYKAYDPSDGRGKARLWKKSDPSTTKEPATRYGPWNLVCKNRDGVLPMMSAATKYWIDGYDVKCEELIANWKAYADNATLETGGLSDNDQLMLEFAVQNKSGELTWPREAAAKAGRVRRLAEEDRKFRRLLQGLGDDGSIILKPPSLVGLGVDAMDSTGRWYTVQILEVDIVDDDTDEDVEDDISRGGKSTTNQQAMSRKKVKVSFPDHGDHSEWIDVESDRLATAGRFARHTDQDGATPSSNQGTTDQVNNTNNTQSPSSTENTSKASKPVAAARKNVNPNNDESNENAKLCTFPGFGACGLSNLGNTCYMNSALQCMSYLPLLRSYLLSAQYRATGDLNTENVLGSGGKLLEETAELMRFLWSANLGEKSPTKFRSALGKMNPQFFGADQQDAQEFLNYIIDALHEDSYKRKEKPYVEPLEDDFVKSTKLVRVGEEAWRRFLRRNRSMMADVAMGQALNTVTCPVCNFSSRIFDPFNLLSIPIPTISDVLFQCTVYRRATAKNCPYILGKVRKGDKRNSRFDTSENDEVVGAPPSEHFIAEQYVIALSRLADSGDLRLQIQNLSGIRANQLRLCRTEEVTVNKDVKDSLVVKTQKRVFPLSDKDGPASQHAKKRGPNDDNNPRVLPTEIIAFEMTLNARVVEASKNAEVGDEEEEDEAMGEEYLPSPKMASIIEKYLEAYGDELECRMVDTDALVIAKAVSRSLWPRSEDELKLGLRVDAMDHRGNWFPGSVIEIVDEKVKHTDTNEIDAQGVAGAVTSKRVRVHFDNFSSKWDEMYSIEHLKQGRVRPLYSHAVPKRKPAEFLVHHRYTDRQTGQLVVFGQSFYVQCQNEWSNARAGAHILAQVSRFLLYNSKSNGPNDSEQNDARNTEQDLKAQRLYEKTHAAISDLIDLLVDCDREYVRLALGVSQHNNAEEKSRPFRNPTFDASLLSSALIKKVGGLLQRLPFEVCICTVEGAHSDKPSPNSEEVFFPFSLVRTIGNFMNIRNAVFLHWRETTIADKKQPTQVVSFRNYLNSPVMYVEPVVRLHHSSQTLLNGDEERDGKKKKIAGNNTAGGGGSAGIDLSYCLKEFCKVQKLAISDNWKCPICKVHREGGQNMNLWRLPDLLTFHIKRFNMSARWHEKITTKVNFPVTGLDLREFCHPDSPVLVDDRIESSVYDLIGVMNHYGSMTGGHYVATCKATACTKDGREEVAYSFNGMGASTTIDPGQPENGNNTPSSDSANTANLTAAWVRLGGGRNNKNQQELVNQNRILAVVASKAASESAEPLWLQFDDEVVEPISPKCVVSEMAYVLFYRRRNISPSNIAKYSTLE